MKRKPKARTSEPEFEMGEDGGSAAGAPGPGGGRASESCGPGGRVCNAAKKSRQAGSKAEAGRAAGKGRKPTTRRTPADDAGGQTAQPRDYLHAGNPFNAASAN
jgi:hypothetical protein